MAPSKFILTGAAVLCALAASCGGGKRGPRAAVLFEAAPSSPMPEVFTEKKRSANDGYVACRAEIDRAPEAYFGFDIAREFDVVPVILTVTLVSRDAQVALTEADLSPVLFLENGTALRAIPAEDLREEVKEKFRAKFNNRMFRGGILQDMGGSASRATGYLFFAVPDNAKVQGTDIQVAGGGSAGYAVALDRSLLRLNYQLTVDGQPAEQTIHVGTE